MKKRIYDRCREQEKKIEKVAAAPLFCEAQFVSLHLGFDAAVL
jgi:hypothetical protein